MKIIIKDNEHYLQTELTTGNKAWVAHVRGLHERLKYDREFFNSTRKGIRINNRMVPACHKLSIVHKASGRVLVSVRGPIYGYENSIAYSRNSKTNPHL